MGKTTSGLQEKSVIKLIINNTLPSMISMLMVLIYNMADMFFVGQTGNPLQVASVSFATPMFLFYLSISTIFGVGGASIISRSLGRGENEKVKKISSFCFWCSIVCGFLLSIFVLCFSSQIATALGATSGTHKMVKDYIWILALSGPFITGSNTFSTIIRAEGAAAKSTQGMIIGNIVNIVLDPLFISTFSLGVAGAAIATAIGNVSSGMFYLIYLIRPKTMLSCKPKHFSFNKDIIISVLIIGIPACMDLFLMSIAQGIVNSLTSGYGDLAVAGMGVAMKVLMLTTMVTLGFGQGIQPILGFCVGARETLRYKKIMKASTIICFSLSLILTILTYSFLSPITTVFLTEPKAFEYAIRFGKIFLSSAIFYGIFFVLLNALQASGAAVSSLIVNVSRQGIIYIPMIYLFNFLFEVDGIAWSLPVTHVISTIIAFLLYLNVAKNIHKKS